IEPGGGKADAVVNEFLKELEEGHHGVAFFAQEKEDHQPADGSHVREEAAAEQGARLRGRQAEHAGKERRRRTAEDVAEGSDEGKEHNFRFPDFHDPEGADEGHGAESQQNETLQKEPKPAEPCIGAQKTFLEKTADSVPEKEPERYQGEG
ncbi:MAG: hypothetical protein GX859_11850, partial [Corynebacterium humireducens]|nr:hypothetical protein [Corynebacterium humireducens]